MKNSGETPSSRAFLWALGGGVVEPFGTSVSESPASFQSFPRLRELLGLILALATAVVLSWD